MKYIKKINLIDITDNKQTKKEIEKNYNLGAIYYENLEKKKDN